MITNPLAGSFPDSSLWPVLVGVVVAAAGSAYITGLLDRAFGGARDD